jgi:hypothetical protein
MSELHEQRSQSDSAITTKVISWVGRTVFVVWQVGSIDEARKRAGELTFSKKGLMTVVFTKLNPF